MRQRFIQDPETGELIPADEYRPKAATHHYVMPDIQGYRSMASGEYITSRSRHREELKRHGLIEVGNEIKAATTHAPKPPDRELRRRQIAEVLNNR